MAASGPRPLEQHRTCVSGAACGVSDFQVVGPSGGDLFMVMDTCGASQAVVWASAAASGASIAASPGGGGFRLCWCGGGGAPCSSPEAFVTDFGEMSVIGPAPLAQDRTCVAGQPCALEGLSGHHLSSSNRLLLLDTCGAAALPTGLPQAALDIVVAHGAARATTGTAALRGAGGSYRLCWCAGLRRCSALDEFRVDMGLVTLLGVSSLAQRRTCVAGRTCLVTGIPDAHQLDRVLVLDTCGSAAVRAELPHASGLGSAVQSGAGSFGGDAVLLAPGGEYRLCWCAGEARCRPTVARTRLGRWVWWSCPDRLLDHSSAPPALWPVRLASRARPRCPCA